MPDKDSIFVDWFQLGEEQEEQDSLFAPEFQNLFDEEEEEDVELTSFEFNPATQDATTFNRPVFSLERDGDKNNVVPFPAGDFYDIISEDDDDEEEAPKLLKDIKKKEGTFVPEPEITEDFRLPTEEEEEKLYPLTDREKELPKYVVEELVDQMVVGPTSQLFYDRPSTFKMGRQTEGYEKDKEKLEAYLNMEYFTKSQHLKNVTTYTKKVSRENVEGTDNLSALTEKQKGRLLKDFKYNLGELGTDRTAYPNLEDYHLDEIFKDVLNTQITKEKLDIAVEDQYAGINDILTKKEKDDDDATAIAKGIDRLDNGKINGRDDKNETDFARIVKELKTKDLDDETRKKYENAINTDIPGSLGDILYNTDEYKYDPLTRTRRKTGKRIPKDKKFELYHDPVSGENYKFGTRKVAEKKGGSVVNITDAYQIYLNKFKNTSLDDLTKFNHQLLLEEAGYKVENQELGDYYIGDQIIRSSLTDKGYEMDAKGVFKDVPLGVLTKLSNTPGKSDFWGRDVFMAKGEIIPQNYKNKPYETEEEFLDFLRVRRQQGHDIAAKSEAMFQTYYLNRDISSINKNRSGQFFGSFAKVLLGERTTQEQFGFTNQDVIDVFANEILNPSGVDVTPDQAEIFKRTVGDRAYEGLGSLAGMVTILAGTVNPVAKALGFNKLIAGISAPRYLATRLTWNGTKAGTVITQAKVIKDAASVGKSIAKYADDIGLKILPVTGIQKGTALVAGALLEEIKLGPVLGAMTDDRVRFETGVGAGFYLMPKLIPFGFGRWAQGKPLGMVFKSNQMNTFMQSTFVNAPSFALAVEGGDALNALTDDMMGREEVYGWAKHHWGDREENMIRIGLNLVNGKVLGMMHFNHLDYKKTEQIGDFNIESIGLFAKDYKKISELAEEQGITPEEFMLQNPNHKDVKKAQKHHIDWMLSEQRLDLINETADWTDAAKAKKTHEDHYKPLTDLFESKGKKLQIEVTDKPIYQTIWKNGREVSMEVSALYTRMSENKDGIAKIQINTTKTKGKSTASHEGLHAWLDIMFDGNIKMKEAFFNNFKEALISMKTPGNSNVYEDILKTKDIREVDKLEELMAYSSEYLGKVENYNALVSNQVFTKMGKFWNNFAESTLGVKADVTLKQDIIDLLGTYGRTGDIRKLDQFAELAGFGEPVGVKVKGGQVGTKGENINTTVEKIKKEKAAVLKNLNDINIAKPEGYRAIAEEKRGQWNKLDARQKELEKQSEIEEVKETGWDQQIDKNYTGTHKTQKDFQKSPEFKKISEDIMKSAGLENMIIQAQTKLRVKEKIKGEFVEDAKANILDRFIKHYDPGKINPEYGRALTPWEFLTTGHLGGESRIYRAIGDVVVKFKKQVPTTEVDAFEGGYEAFEREGAWNVYNEGSGYLDAAKPSGSKIEQEGIVLATGLKGMRKKVGTKEVLNKKTGEIEEVDVTLGDRINEKSGADAKNLDWEAEGAKDIVSYKNIGKNAEKTIGKDIVVDYYKVTPEMYKKMQKRADQQLNNGDIENIQKVVKPEIEKHIKLLPHWSQVIVDPVTGKNVAFKKVSGVPSEPKATNVTTVLLHNKLLYKEIPQPGTKSSKYKYSDRMKEYLKTADRAVKKKFEQDVLESWGMGDTKLTRAQYSSLYKGLMIQTAKAMYVQGSTKALPEISELTVRYPLANMVNQVSAGKSSALAAKDVNAVMKLLEKSEIDIFDVYDALPNSPKAYGRIEDLILKRDALTIGPTEYILRNEKMEMELEGKSKKELEAEAITNEKNIKSIAIKNNLSPKHCSRTEISKNPKLIKWEKGIHGEVMHKVVEKLGISLTEGDALPTHRKQQRVSGFMQGLGTEFGFSNQMTKVQYPNGKKAYLNLEGMQQGEAIEKNLNIKTKYTGKTKNTKWLEKVYSPDFQVQKRTEALEKELLNKVKKDGTSYTEKEIADAKIELIRTEGSYSGKSKDFEVTEAANDRLAGIVLEAKIEVALKNRNNFGVEWLLQDRAIQTNARNGITKSMIYNIGSVPALSSKPGKIKVKNAEGKWVEKDNFGKGTHWEHALQLIHNTQFVIGIAKKYNSIHKNNIAKLRKNIKRLKDGSQQHLIPKNGEIWNDSKGPTSFAKLYGKDGLVNLSHNALLNVFNNRYARMTNQYVVSGVNKGKTLAEVEVEQYSINTIKSVLSKLSKSEWGVFEYQLNHKLKHGEKIDNKNKKALEKVVGKNTTKDLASKDINKTMKAIDKAIAEGRKKDKKSRGMSTFDFDRTAGDSQNFIFATKGKNKKKISATEWPVVGEKLRSEGWEFDFTDFNKVTKGKPGPLMPKLKNQIKKFGNKDVFILTARAPESAQAIYDFLKSEGAEVPLKNITGLGNSTGEAKAMWMLEKFAEGYNDMYFVDDALPNVKAVKNVLDQLDIKSKVQQALATRGDRINKQVNDVMEHSLGIESKKRFTKAEAYARGKDIKRRRIIMPDANADLELLIEPLYGKGKQGIENRKWFEKNFYRPWERGINDLNTARQTILNDYKNLRKQNKDIIKSFDKAVEGTNFTNDQAMRVYIWNKNGFKIPDLAAHSETKLVDHVKNNPKLQAFADNVAVLTKIETGLKKPSEVWMAETLASEVSKTGRTIDRNKYLAEWIEIKNEVFSKENLNKMETKLGTRWRSDIEDMFNRMETGRTRSLKMTETGNQIMDYLNGAVGATMSLNMRSGVLQSISSVNFLNFSDNSVLMAGKAFANAPQYWKDFKYILNSDMLVQRREGLKININEAELAAVAAEGKNAYQRALAWTLKQGFIPTKIVDSFAIAAGGATFYRNRINTYLKEGFSQKEAESKAWLDFQSTAEKTQQSSRPDLLSRQQTSFEGRLILPFANTPIQMNRIMLKEILDVSKGRYDGYFGEQSLTHKLSKISYFGAAQTIIFATLQSGLFALMVHGDEDDDFDDAIANKKIRTANTVTDSFLRGMSVQGAVVAGFKNAVLEFLHQQGKGNSADYSEVAEDLLNISPTVGSKVSHLDAAGNTYKWNREEIHEKGFSLDNTKAIEAAAQTVQAITNWPTHRVVRKDQNIDGALNEQNAAWQRFWMIGGWSPWDIGVERSKKKKKKKTFYEHDLD